MKHERTLKTAIVLGVTAAHIGLYAALDKVTVPPEPVEVEQLTMVDLDALAGGDKAADSPPPAAKPAPPPPPPKPKPKPEPPKPKPKAPEPKPVVKAVVKDNAPPDLRPERETPKPKPPKPKPEPKQPKPKPEPKPPKPQPEPQTAEPVEKPQPAPKKLKMAVKHADSEAKPAETGNSRASAQASAGNGSEESKGRPSASSGGGNGRDDKAGGGSGSRERGDGGNGGDSKRKNNGDDDKPKKAFGGIADGGYRTMPVVDYPEASLENGEEGTVKIKVIVEPNGRVSDADVVSSSGHARLDKAALRAAKSASYKPKSVDGEPVRTRFTAVYKFNI